MANDGIHQIAASYDGLLHDILGITASALGWCDVMRDLGQKPDAQSVGHLRERLSDLTNYWGGLKKRRLIAVVEDGAQNLIDPIDRILKPGTPVVRVDGHGFPGEVRAAFLTRDGKLRYAVEATGSGYAGMFRVFHEYEIQRAS
jgi:hypothetical protein